MGSKPEKTQDKSMSGNLEDSTRERFQAEIPIIIRHEIGLDPEKLPSHRLHVIAATRALFYCESLFWTLKQLGLAAEHGGWIFQPHELYEALQHIGEIGQAIASATGEHVEIIERLAEEQQGSQGPNLANS